MRSLLKELANNPASNKHILYCLLTDKQQGFSSCYTRKKHNTYTSYSFIWPSSEAVKSSCESGEKHNDLMGMAWPVNKRFLSHLLHAKQWILSTIFPQLLAKYKMEITILYAYGTVDRPNGSTCRHKYSSKKNSFNPYHTLQLIRLKITAQGSMSQALRNRPYNTFKGVNQFSRSNIKNVDNTINCSTGNILSIWALKNQRITYFSSQVDKVPFTIAWCMLRLHIKEMYSRYGKQLYIY